VGQLIVGESSRLVGLFIVGERSRLVGQFFVGERSPLVGQLVVGDWSRWRSHSQLIRLLGTGVVQWDNPSVVPKNQQVINDL